MPFNDSIVVETQLVTPPPPPPDTARTWAVVAAASPAGYSTKRYSTIGEMNDDGWTNAQSAYVAMAKLFAQTPTDTALGGIIVIKRATAVAEIWAIDINSTTDGNHTISIGGVLAATFAASANTATEIKDGLIAAFDAGPFGSAIDAASIDADSLSLTGLEAGIPFLPTVAVPGGTIHDVTQTQASVGVYQDLDAAHALFKFRNVLMPAASDPELDEGDRWTGADRTTRRCFLFAENNDAGVYDSGDTDNLAVKWLTASRERVNLLSHPNATEHMAFAVAGRIGAAYPGSRAAHYLPLAGSLESAITANRTSDQTATMKARRMSWTERYDGPTSKLLLISVGPNVPSGVFVFQRWAEDQLWYIARALCDSAMSANPGVNLDDAGLRTLVDTISPALLEMVTEGVLAADYTVSYVPLDQVPAGELAIGDYKTTGAIVINATVTPKLRALRVTAYLAVV